MSPTSSVVSVTALHHDQSLFPAQVQLCQSSEVTETCSALIVFVSHSVDKWAQVWLMVRGSSDFNLLVWTHFDSIALNLEG